MSCGRVFHTLYDATVAKRRLYVTWKCNLISDFPRDFKTMLTFHSSLASIGMIPLQSTTKHHDHRGG